MIKNAPATETVIPDLVSKLDFRIPEDYLSILLEMDGCEGVLGSAYKFMTY